MVTNDDDDGNNNNNNNNNVVYMCLFVQFEFVMRFVLVL